jgi:hypothetical protein
MIEIKLEGLGAILLSAAIILDLVINAFRFVLWMIGRITG